jgi:hypothetical protein
MLTLFVYNPIIIFRVKGVMSMMTFSKQVIIATKLGNSSWLFVLFSARSWKSLRV